MHADPAPLVLNGIAVTIAAANAIVSASSAVVMAFVTQTDMVAIVAIGSAICTGIRIIMIILSVMVKVIVMSPTQATLLDVSVNKGWRCQCSGTASSHQ